MDLCAVGRRTRTVAAPPCSALFALTSDARNSVTDDVLVKLARQGDETAMAELLARYEGKLLRLAMRIVRNEHDAEEIVQDVSFTVWRKLPGFEGRAQIGTWLYRITVNASLMLLRTRGRNPQTCSQDGRLADDGIGSGCVPFETGCRASFTPDDQLQFAELHCEIERAVDDLPSGLRTVFMARAVEGRSTRQTAESLGLSAIAVKTRLHRARAMLRANIEG